MAEDLNILRTTGIDASPGRDWFNFNMWSHILSILSLSLLARAGVQVHIPLEGAQNSELSSPSSRRISTPADPTLLKYEVTLITTSTLSSHASLKSTPFAAIGEIRQSNVPVAIPGSILTHCNIPRHPAVYSHIFNIKCPYLLKIAHPSFLRSPRTRLPRISG